MTDGLKLWDAVGNLIFGPQTRPSRFIDSVAVAGPSGSRAYSGEFNELIFVVRGAANVAQAWSIGNTVYWSNFRQYMHNGQQVWGWIVVFDRGL